ncbi:MAG TPA: biotin transporter BioY [Acetobacteraceae bacterium]|jgi:biotin transport system substrate-specific component|nr:biotin transporter BioY [Acetobacteraceae bacterium]
MTAIASLQVLATRLWPRTDRNALARAILLIVLADTLLALSAHLQVPFWPVRLSMQSFVVLAIGIAYGRRLGALTVLAYLAEGAAGLPVFQAGVGLAYLAGPTGGYLLGFLLSAFTVGALAERGALTRWPLAVGVILLGEVCIYAPGLAWLAVLFGPSKAVAFGLTPFLPAELVKMALALALLPWLRPAGARQGP